MWLEVTTGLLGLLHCHVADQATDGMIIDPLIVEVPTRLFAGEPIRTLIVRKTLVLGLQIVVVFHRLHNSRVIRWSFTLTSL